MLKSALVIAVVVVVAGCAGSRAGGKGVAEPRQEVTATLQVQLPADPYTPTAQAMPLLHHIGYRVCGGPYRIANRKIGRSFESTRQYVPEVRAVVPGLRHGHAVVATIECLSRY